MKHVLLASSVYPPASGGPALQTFEIARALATRGYRATVLTLETDRSHPEAAGVEVRRLRLQKGRIRRNLALLRDMFAALEELKPDIVHTNVCEGPFPLFMGIASKRHAIPSIVKFSADLVWNKLNRDEDTHIAYEQIHTSSLRARALTALQRRTFFSYELVWATSPFQQRALLDIYGLPSRRTHLLPNLVEVKRVSPRPSGARPFTALLVARMVPWKGVEVAIDAVARAEARGVRLRIIGGGDPRYVESLRARVRSLGIDESVDFVGEVPSERVQNEFLDADVFVLPSIYEPFGIVLVQAMSAGLPIVGSNVGGIPYVVDDARTGLLVPPRDPAALARAIGELAGNDVKRKRMGEEALAACRRFDLETNFEALLEMYEIARTGRERRRSVSSSEPDGARVS